MKTISVERYGREQVTICVNGVMCGSPVEETEAIIIKRWLESAMRAGDMDIDICRYPTACEYVDY